jgi:hypothetical protein
MIALPPLLLDTTSLSCLYLYTILYRFTNTQEDIMFCIKVVKKSLLSLLCITFSITLLTLSQAHATLPTLDYKVIADSDEPFNRRIYSYDLGIDSTGIVHIAYTKPYSSRKSNIYYVKRVSGAWQSQVLLTADGFQDNKSTFISIDKNDDIYVCYIKDMGAENTPSENLYYRKISKTGSVGPEIVVDGGGWWSRMQLDDNDNPMFVRVSRDWDDPNTPSRLSLLTTTNGTTWTRKLLDLKDVNQYRISNFVYSNGTYHLTYGDSAYTKEVWNGKEMTARVPGTFHNLLYAKSTDGINWDEYVVDNSGTLFALEFWIDLVLVNNRPLIAMYKYNEYQNKFSLGTSTILYEWTGNGFDNGTIITNQEYLDTNEGMGVGLAVNADGDYFGAWDFSAPYPQIIPGSARGNTAMSRSGSNGKWEDRVQLDPFSLEGSAKLRVFGNSLHFLALGDYTDSKLYYHEFSIPKLNTILPAVTPIVPGGSGNNLGPATYQLLLDNQ